MCVQQLRRIGNFVNSAATYRLHMKLIITTYEPQQQNAYSYDVANNEIFKQTLQQRGLITRWQCPCLPVRLFVRSSVASNASYCWWRGLIAWAAMTCLTINNSYIHSIKSNKSASDIDSRNDMWSCDLNNNSYYIFITNGIYSVSRKKGLTFFWTQCTCTLIRQMTQ